MSDVVNLDTKLDLSQNILKHKKFFKSFIRFQICLCKIIFKIPMIYTVRSISENGLLDKDA